MSHQLHPPYQGDGSSNMTGGAGHQNHMVSKRTHFFQLGYNYRTGHFRSSSTKSLPTKVQDHQIWVMVPVMSAFRILWWTNETIFSDKDKIIEQFTFDRPAPPAYLPRRRIIEYQWKFRSSEPLRSDGEQTRCFQQKNIVSKKTFPFYSSRFS